MAEGKSQTTLRFSPPVADRLAQIAKDTGQSRTDQIEEALIEKWSRQTILSSDTLTIIKQSAEQILDAVTHAESLAVEHPPANAAQGREPGRGNQGQHRRGKVATITKTAT